MNEKNMNLVEEGKQLITNMELFRTIPNKKENFQILDDFEIAYSYAFDDENYNYFGEEGYTWSDIKSLEFSKVKQKVYVLDSYKELNQYIRDISIPELSTQIVSKESNQIFDEIYSDLTICLRTRAIEGVYNFFFENIFKAYNLGGWPCGWSGKYPEGKLIVYFSAK